MLNKEIVIFLLLFSAVIAMASCSGHKSEQAQSSPSGDASAVKTIRMPDVPASVTDPTERADYLLLHFWDSVDFTDRAAMSDSIMIEQGMSDFISVMDYCSPEGIEEGVGKLLSRASVASPEAYGRVAALAELYLWDSQSPFRSEAFYTPFAEYALTRGGDEKERAEAILDDIARNAPGSVAPDFIVTGTDGHRFSLASLTDEGRPVAVMFYEPDCDHCLEAIASLTSNPDFNRLIENGQLTFLAVYIGNEYEKWSEHAASLPLSWKTGIDRARLIDEKELYKVGSTPSFYIIGSDRRILLKDSGLNHFYQAVFG